MVDSKSFCDGLVQRIEGYCSEHGIEESAFGRLVMDDGRLVDRIRAGKVSILGIRKAEEVLSAPPRKRASVSGAAA